MPVSKKGNRYHTAEQLQKAKQASALEYALANGYNLVPDGSLYRLKEHDSMVFKPNGWWCWNSQNLSGGAIELLMHYEGYNYVDAVCLLAGENVNNMLKPRTYERPTPLPPVKEFKLPQRNDTHRRVFAYLTQTRGISGNIVRKLMDMGLIYESKERHNATFVLRDVEGKAKGAFLRGTNNQLEKQFKGLVAGSDNANSLFYFGDMEATNKKIMVFEAAIDSLSVATMIEQCSSDSLKDTVFLSTGGAGHKNVLRFITKHSNTIHKISLCQDNDQAGETFAADLWRELNILEADCAKDFQVERIQPKYIDFNEDLIKKNELLLTIENEQDIEMEL